MKKIKRALISVSDKKNLKPLLNILKKNKVEIISSGGTYKIIRKLKFNCTEISKYTDSHEILDGRVKTLHPKIHAGILYKRNNKTHVKDLKKNKFKNIDLVIVNFYPFEETLKNTIDHHKIIENIDIGGPTMVRAAAKNYNDVTVLTSKSQYNEFINQMIKFKGSTSQDFRKKMSQMAFTETAYYDALVSDYFNRITDTNFPQRKIIHGNLVEKLRYGENPHQESAIYSRNYSLKINQIHGKQLSYNNYNDIFSALTISKSFPKSGNTYLRSFLASYYFSKKGKFDFKLLMNILQFPSIRFSQKDFLSFEDAAKNWIPNQKFFFEKEKLFFLKTHNTLNKFNNFEFTTNDETLGAIYIVRDPRNVITSMCNHF